MIKRIVDNIYTRCKFFTFNINHVLKKNNKILIIFYFILPILIDHNKSYNKKLAFQTYIIDSEKKIQVNNLNGNNQKYFSKILPNYNNKIIKYKVNIKKILEYLKNTGILNQLDYFIFNINNFRYYTIHLYINSNINKIEVYNYKYLKIPQRLLINILKPQVGSPINYSKIHNTINKIYIWYIRKGFTYIKIKLRYKKLKQSLYLEIFEGKIFAKYLTYKSNIVLSSNMVNKINNMLIKELNISKKSIFNKKKIDRGIIYLKKIQLLKACQYKVRRHKQGLILNIEYSICNHHHGYIYHHHSNIRADNLLIYNIMNYSYPVIIPIDSYVLPTILQNFMKQILYINEVYTFYLKYKNDFTKTFNFKYYLHYINHSYKIHVKTINNIPQFEFLLFIPYINKTIFNCIKFHIYQSICKNKIIHSTKNKVKSKIVYDVNIKSIGTCIIINQNILKNLNYRIKYLNMFNLFKEQFFYLKTSLNQSLKLRYQNKLIKQKVILINTQIRYNTLKCNQLLVPGKIFILEFLCLRPQKIIKENILHKNKSSNNIKLKYYQIISPPNYLKFIKKNTINIFININSIIKHNYENLLNNIEDIHLQIYFQQKNTRVVKYNIKYLYQLEYHVFLGKFCSYYIFSDMNGIIYNKNKIFQYNHIAGSGIQINPPIQKIPKIRFEYKINKYDMSHYHIRLFSPYITNN